MRVSLSILFFVFALVGCIHSATLSLEERYIGVPLPGLSNIIQELKQYLNNSLNVFPDLTMEQRDQLIEELVQGLRDFPNANNIETIKPSQLPQYLSQVYEYAEKMTIALMAKAKNLVASNKSEGTDKREIQHSPAVGTVLIILRKTFEIALFEITGLTKAQQQELVDEFLRQMKNFPPITGYVIQYLEDVKEFGKNVIDALLAKAKALAASNNQRSTRFALPGLSELVDEVRQKITDALKSIDGLTSRQRLQLVDELLQSVRNYPNVNGIHTIKPSQFGVYVQQIHAYADEKINYLVAKAHDLAESNKQGKGITRQARFIPGFDKVVTFLQEKLDAALYKITGVTREQHKELVNEFLTQMQDFPTINGWDLLQPSKLAGYLGELRQFGKSVVAALIAKGKAFVDINKNPAETREVQHAPSFGKIVDFLQKALYKSLFAVTGLTKEQTQELVNEFKQQMKNFPSIRGYVVKYLDDVREFGKNVVDALLTKARALAALNSSSKRAIGVALPGLSNLVDDLRQKLNDLLDEFIGLSTEQKNEIVEELMQSLRDFPNANNIETVKPSQYETYIKQIQEFAEKMITALMVKAKSLGEDSEAAVQRQARFLPGVDKVVDFLKNNLDKALYRLTGVTKEQHKELVNDFVDQMQKFPVPSWQVIIPGNMEKYIEDVREFGNNLANALLAKAKAFADLNKSGVSKRAVDAYTVSKRQISLPSFITDMHSRMVQTAKNLLQKVTGLTTEQQEALTEEFKQKLSQLPLPPLKVFDLINPIKWSKYIYELTVYNIRLTRDIMNKAVKLVKGTLGEDYEVPDVEDIIERRAEDRGVVVETVKKAFDALVNNIPGINDVIKMIIIAEFDSELSKFPPPPKGFNPLAWLSYQSKLVAYQAEITQRLVTKAKALLKDQVDKINPGLGKLLQKKDTE